MKMNAAPRILIVAGLCVASLIALVLSEGAARAAGQEIVLPMAAVDPRTLLGGHYVQIDLRQPLAPGEECPTPHQDWDWVALRPAGDVHRLAGGAPSREEAQQVGPVPVKGRFVCAPGFVNADGSSTPGFVQLDLGVERFYVNQTDAMRIDRIMREQAPGEATRVFAIVSVGRDGRGRLKGLIVDGERLDLSWL